MPDSSQIPYVNLVKRASTPDEIRDVPILGDLYNAGNTVINYFESDCHPDWHVYAETLFPALGEVVLVLLSFGLDDVLRGYFRPAGGRGFGGLGRASRRGWKPTKAQRARGVLRGGIPEVGELVGRNLPGAQVVRARQVSQAERFLWRVDGLAQRGLWYWLIADLTDDFVVNWTTALYQSEACIGLNVAGATLRDVTIGAVGEGFRAITLNEEVDKWGDITIDPRRVVVPSGTTANIAFNCPFTEEIAPPGGAVAVVQSNRPGAVPYFGPPATFNPDTGRWETGLGITVPGGETYEWGIWHNGFGWTVSPEAEVTVLLQHQPAS